MQRQQFLAELRTLADKAMKSNDEAVIQSAVVLLGLSGAITAGDEFLEPFIDSVAATVQNQLEMLKLMTQNGD